MGQSEIPLVFTLGDVVHSLDTDIGVVASMVGTRATQEVLETALEALRRVIPCDLAAVLRKQGHDLVVQAAVGPLASDAVRSHRVPLHDAPTLRRAIASRTPVPLEEHHHDGEGDPYDGVLDLDSGHSCMVVPLFSGSEDLGVITLDCQVCGVYTDEVVTLAGVFGQLVALAIRFSDQAEALERARRQLAEENRLLEVEAGADAATARMENSASARMQEIARQARQVAATDLPVLVLGETGTGKEVACQAIHTWSPRRDRPYVKLNCAAIPESLVESELFGHVRGAFSGAEAARDGRFLTADGGTLLLDEVGELPLSAQAKLLRVLQEGCFEPVGSDKTVAVDVRVLAATHVDLEQAVNEGRFRRDLMYRLAVFPLTLPPLRERREEIVPIARTFLAEEAARSRRGPWTLPDDSIAALMSAPWRGNIRELRNVLERATILVPSGPLRPVDLGRVGGVRQALAPSPTVLTWEDNERAYLQALLEHTDGKLYGPDGAAARAGLKPTTLRSKLVRFGLR